MQSLLEFHRIWAYVAIVANGIVGVAALVVWRASSLRGRWLWIATFVAEAAMMIQVVTGAILVSSEEYVAPAFHMFYGFLAFLTVGLAYQFRNQMRGRREMLYGLAGLFLMGLGIRAIFQVT
jgi:Co/Zn/Cd efflux system component